MRIFGDNIGNRIVANVASRQNEAFGVYELQGCSWQKKIKCASAVAACAATCASGSWPACVLCFANVGASDCIDCL